jgi:bifunctional non-homologous end joining protein LigD
MGPAKAGDANMALEKYEAKRVFDRTPEPPARPGRPHRKPIFVMQEHNASRLHYDFRLEADGVLKSWAVPKQPSMDPATKRLAVQVEDHPLDYAVFEGTIPEGQYGAGTVSIWDRGTYDNLLTDKPVPQTVAEGTAEGRLEFTLHGEKLRGNFALIRMGGKRRGKDNWLLIKLKDELAPPEADGDDRPARKASVGRAAKARTSSPRRRHSGQPPAEGVSFTNLDKVMFPEGEITKREVIEYYRRIAPRLCRSCATGQRLWSGCRTAWEAGRRTSGRRTRRRRTRPGSRAPNCPAWKARR